MQVPAPLAFSYSLRQGLVRRFLMSDSSQSASSPSRLKRSFAQQATASLSHQTATGEYSTHAKYPKLEDVLPSSSGFHSKDAEPTRSTLKMPLSGPPLTRPPKSASIRLPRSTASGRVPSKGKSKLGPFTAMPNAPMLESPFHDRVFIVHEHTTKSRNPQPIKPAYEDNPKSPLSNFFTIVMGRAPEYQSVLGVYPDKHEKIWRTSVTMESEVTIVGIGDSPNKKESEKLAALSAVYQLHDARLLDAPKSKSEPPTLAEVPTTAKLSDSTEVTHALARQFMDYYCRRFQFGKPDITFEEIRGGRGPSTWEAVMIVGGRRIGLGAGPTKKAAQISCYLDVTQYLESRDRQLWETFVEAAKTGKDLGMAPKVYLDISDGLSDKIRDLCHEMRRSTLYSHRPAAKWLTSESERQVLDSQKTSDFRGQVSSAFLAEKSKRLLKRYQTYLESPNFKTMRDNRASLPVYTRSDDITAHIRENDVTILMASTGSGKTTQVPQLVLEDYIRRGEGANCNILCTQPRRIAAISVADRVAKERGELVGRGTVGYQVRFDSSPPEEHGSITYCTTGVFLKRMQSALSPHDRDMGTTGLANVTHVIIDEVHERDVDTDLLLVVLKRFMVSRKAMKNPIKVILMSATIDPTLFQNYFLDDDGQPARVLEVPGRSFPVTKHFLEDFIVDLFSSSQTKWALTQDSVIKYLRRELEPTIAFQLGLHHGITQQTRLGFDSDREEELELSYPLITLTIAHVLQKTKSGHVLVFLPGWDEIINVQNALLNPLGPLGLDFHDTQSYNIHLLHSTIPLSEQQKVFEPPPPSVRRIILATNIAETSITIPDVVYVLDTGKIKEQRYDPHRHMSSIVSAWVGSSNLNQRAGRAGRHRSGEYFGLLGRKRAAELHPHQTVEMKRVDLSNVVMHVKALNFPGVTVEEVLSSAIEPPGAGRVEAAMKDLQMVGAMDEEKQLTSLGRVLLQLPVDVQMGRLVLFGSFFRCLDQALTLAAILTNRDPFVSPIHLKVEATHKKNSWTSRDFRSDALATLQAYNAWWALQSKGQYQSANRFCTDNFLSKPTLLLIQKIKVHLLQSLYRAGVIDVSAGGRSIDDGSRTQRLETVPPELNINGHSSPLLAALIAIASQPKFAIRTGERIYRTVQDKVVFIHPSSVNNRKREPREQDEPLHERELYAFTEKRQNTSVTGGGTVQTYLITTTRLDPMTYMLFGAYRLEVAERGLECDGWLPIQGNVDALDDIQRLKSLLEACMLRVFDGISISKQRNIHQRMLSREERESEDDDDKGARSMSPIEIKELDKFTCAIVDILNQYSEERMASQSRQSSRPATPMGSPSLSSVRLPSGPWSGYSSPYNVGSAYNSRPGTPSRLSRRI